MHAGDALVPCLRMVHLDVHLEDATPLRIGVLENGARA